MRERLNERTTYFFFMPDSRLQMKHPAYEAQQMQRQHMQEFVDKFYNEKRSSAQAARVKQAMSRQKALEKMELIEDPRKDIDPDSHRLRFPDPGVKRRERKRKGKKEREKGKRKRKERESESA
jgi:hypothetical protein